MNDLVLPSSAELQALTVVLELAIARPSPTAHRTFQFKQGLDDDVLPFLYDFLESRDCSVVHVFTLPLRDGVFHREVVFRVRGLPLWNGAE